MYEREVGQWYQAGGSDTAQLRAAFDALPEQVRRRCYQYGSLVSWHLLPADARAAVAQVRAEIVAEGERIQRNIEFLELCGEFAVHESIARESAAVREVLRAGGDMREVFQNEF